MAPVADNLPSDGKGNTMIRGRLPAAIGAALIILGFAVATAIATPPPGHQVTICHATNSETNPYVVETVDIASSGYLQAGHNDHTGPIWYLGAKDAKVTWGDIIPPYDYAATSFHYAGLNWTDEGESIWENDCEIPAQTEAPSFEQSQAAETDEPSAPATLEPSAPATLEPSATPTFEQSVAGDTDEPTEPATSTVDSQTGGPASETWLLVLALGALLGSLMVVTPGRTRRAHPLR